MKKKTFWQNIIGSPRTTITGVCVILCAVLPQFGVPAVTVTAIASALGGLGLILGKDANVSGTDEPCKKEDKQ